MFNYFKSAHLQVMHNNNGHKKGGEITNGWQTSIFDHSKETNHAP